jgi:hypothetical protein
MRPKMLMETVSLRSALPMLAERRFPQGHFPFWVQLRCAPPLHLFFWASFQPADAAVMVKAAYNVTNASAITRFKVALPLRSSLHSSCFAPGCQRRSVRDSGEDPAFEGRLANDRERQRRAAFVRTIQPFNDCLCRRS